MQQAERRSLVELYERRYAELGRNVRALGWNGDADQRLRFEVLSTIGDLSGASICDVGCGFADLLPFLRERFSDIRYSGIDVTPSFVTEARERFPECMFHCLDLLEEPFDEPFDYFLLSGALNFRVADNLQLTQGMIRRMFALAGKGVGVNFLTSRVNFVREHNYHHDPAAMLAWAQTRTRWVTLRHDYPLWEFTLFLYKDAQPSAWPSAE